MSENLHFDFAPAVRPVSDSPMRKPQAKRTRKLGQLVANLDRATLYWRITQLYRRLGPLTDAEVAAELGIERTTVNARRNELIQLGKVSDTGRTRKNPKSGMENTLWGLV